MDLEPLVDLTDSLPALIVAASVGLATVSREGLKWAKWLDRRNRRK